MLGVEGFCGGGGQEVKFCGGDQTLAVLTVSRRKREFVEQERSCSQWIILQGGFLIEATSWSCNAKERTDELLQEGML